MTTAQVRESRNQARLRGHGEVFKTSQREILVGNIEEQQVRFRPPFLSQTRTCAPTVASTILRRAGDTFSLLLRRAAFWRKVDSSGHRRDE